jgi:hypothetical protein
MKWISVKDRLPDLNEFPSGYKSSNSLLGYDDGFYSIVEYTGDNIWRDEYSKMTIVTHWMPLPPKPETVD